MATFIKCRCSTHRRQRGFALVTVIWTVSLLAIVAVSFQREARTEIELARNLREAARAEALADAGVTAIIVEWIQNRSGDTEAIPSATQTIQAAGGKVVIELEDETGRIDINEAPEAILKGLFLSLGEQQDTASKLAAAIVDFRDGDDAVTADGAEDNDYAAAGMSSDAKDAAFEDIAELQQVAGMTHGLYASLRRHVTVYSGQRQVNLSAASENVLRALPYLNEAQIAGLLADRRGTELGESRLLRIVARATTAQGGAFAREVVVRLGGEQDEPFSILYWGRDLLSGS